MTLTECLLYAWCGVRHFMCVPSSPYNSRKDQVIILTLWMRKIRCTDKVSSLPKGTEQVSKHSEAFLRSQGQALPCAW